MLSPFFLQFLIKNVSLNSKGYDAAELDFNLLENFLNLLKDFFFVYLPEGDLSGIIMIYTFLLMLQLIISLLDKEVR